MNNQAVLEFLQMLTSRSATLFSHPRTLLGWAISLLAANRLLLRIATVLVLVVAICATVIKVDVPVQLPTELIEVTETGTYAVPVTPDSLPGYAVRSDLTTKSRSDIRLFVDGQRAGPEIGAGSGPATFLFSPSYRDGVVEFKAAPGFDPRTASQVFSAVLSARATPLTITIAWLLAIALMVLCAVDFGASRPVPNRAEQRRALRLSRTSGHIIELDGIRGWACLSILLAHCLVGRIPIPSGTFWAGVKDPVLVLLLAGVDLFFVLSGFLIGGILMDTRRHPHFFKRFWIRRVARIIPVLCVLLASYAVALLIRANVEIPTWDRWLLASPAPPFWTYATFTQSFPLAEFGEFGPRWVAITWSLAVEEQFYLLFPLAVFVLSRRTLLAVALAGIIAAPILRDLLERVYGNWYAPYVLLPSRMDGLMFGVLVAIVLRNTRALLAAIRLRRLIDIIAFVALCLVIESYPLRVIWPAPEGGVFPPLKQSLLALIFAVVVLRVFLFEQSTFNRIWRARWLCFFGLISYALYMYHNATNGLLHWLVFDDTPRVESIPQLLTALLVMITATTLATLSYKVLERPVRRFGRKVSDRYVTEAPAAPPLPAIASVALPSKASTASRGSKIG